MAKIKSGTVLQNIYNPKYFLRVLEEKEDGKVVVKFSNGKELPLHKDLKGYLENCFRVVNNPELALKLYWP